MFSNKFIASMFLAALSSAGIAHAQDMTLGEFEYQNSCAACHGMSGKGDGPVTDFLSGAVVPDLTMLQENNGGVFPVAAVFATIDGSETASAHGTRDMPIWGSRLRARASSDPDFSPSDAEAFSQARILALIEYISSLQKQ
ncbi:Cytochrome c [Roseovarius litoreus]|uniref:Cytochrome c n=1 Tax=Roseovarius litoreus TaxID=1155722 RepID=A0A1M7EFE9_9RHOB|nr:c-type cytochrome [Roseovarius litoreus]SHL90368.1 Cytochrome c [Roseovarius litoreus]